MSGVVIVGAGPAGMSAAVAAAQSGASDVTVLDDNPFVGGQIWRGGPPDGLASEWFDRFHRSGAKIMPGARVVTGDASRRTLLVDKNGKAEEMSYQKLILATGARELFLPFPGWTLPNVMGVGGLQALVKSGLPVKGKRIIVAGSGPLLLAVAAYLRKHGATVPLIAEQVAAATLMSFAASLTAHPAKLWQALQLNPFSTRIRYVAGCWVESAGGSGKVASVRLRRGDRVWEETCDYLANAYGFTANTELPALLGCVVEDGSVKVNAAQQTSIEGIYCAGESAGLGGVDTALFEGQIAGHAAAGQTAEAGQLYSSIAKAKSFAAKLNATFQPRAELRILAQAGTVVCRCEDVTFANLKRANSWRSAKLHERCGMGPCQGRICGPAVRFVLGWEPSSVRPPLFPTRIENLIQESSIK